MGSDMAMNPPRQVFDTYECESEDEVAGYVIGALANNSEIRVSERGSDGLWRIRVGTGRWI